MIPIYILTKGRMTQQFSWDNLPPELQAVAWLVCPPEEAQDHVRRGRRALPCHLRGTAPVRQWIIQEAARYGQEKIIMLDDDLRPVQRRQPNGKILIQPKAAWLEAASWLEAQLDEVAHCALGMRSIGWAEPVTKEYQSPARAMKAHGFRVDVIQELGVGFNEGVSDKFGMEDFHMTLQLLERGYPNRVSLEWRIDASVSNAPGGASEWRTADGQSASAHLLEKLHPHTVETKLAKKAWAGMDKLHTDVKVFWKRALDMGTRRAAKESVNE